MGNVAEDPVSENLKRLQGRGSVLEAGMKHASRQNSVASEGFEPPKAEPADLQSDPFGRLGN